MIHYFAFYSGNTSNSKIRTSNYAGDDKIDYICSAITDINEPLTLVSNARSLHGYLPYERKNISDVYKRVYFASLPKSNVFGHTINVLFGFIQIIWYVIFNVKNGDTVLVYHSLGYRNIFSILKRLYGFKYILEIEELFEFFESSNSYKKNEARVFKAPDGYLVSNKFINNRINLDNKPAVVINGIYRIEKKRCEQYKNDKVVVLYAGNLEKQKGVDYIIRSASCLSSKYEIRIIGFGTESDIERISNLIKQVNTTSECKVRFDGALKGEAYIEYCQMCDIGICVQDPNDQFNLFEYPSKVFSYLSNGLKVVTNELEQIKNSDVYNYLYISKGVTPDEIAKAVIEADLDRGKKPDDILLFLDNKFKKELKEVLKGEN